MSWLGKVTPIWVTFFYKTLVERFVLELQNNSYDIVGISAIMTNITPLPGTPFFEQHRKEGTLLDDSEIYAADAHGQYRFNYRHRFMKKILQPSHWKANLAGISKCQCVRSDGWRASFFRSAYHIP